MAKAQGGVRGGGSRPSPLEVLSNSVPAVNSARSSHFVQEWNDCVQTFFKVWRENSFRASLTPLSECMWQIKSADAEWFVCFDISYLILDKVNIFRFEKSDALVTNSDCVTGEVTQLSLVMVSFKNWDLPWLDTVFNHPVVPSHDKFLENVLILWVLIVLAHAAVSSHGKLQKPMSTVTGDSRWSLSCPLPFLHEIRWTKKGLAIKAVSRRLNAILQEVFLKLSEKNVIFLSWTVAHMAWLGHWIVPSDANIIK